MEFTGDLETHITVCLEDSKNLELLQKLAEINGLKCLHIILDRGIMPSQPMLTWRTSGGLSIAIEKARDLKEIISVAGFPVIRIKIEAAPWNEDVPQTQAEVLEHSTKRYFETHIRIQYNARLDNSGLRRIAEMNSAHISRNAFRQAPDNVNERFVTQRCWSIGYLEAHQKLNILLKEIRDSGYIVIDVEEEFVVYDSNLGIDAGWIEIKE